MHSAAIIIHAAMHSSQFTTNLVAVYAVEHAEKHGARTQGRFIMDCAVDR